MLQWFVDVRFVKNKYSIELQVKKTEYNENQYQEILTFEKEKLSVEVQIFGRPTPVEVTFLQVEKA